MNAKYVMASSRKVGLIKKRAKNLKEIFQLSRFKNQGFCARTAMKRLLRMLERILGNTHRSHREGIMPSQIVCMRLDQMQYKHPDQNNSRKCDLCGARVGIYPSGQRALARDPKLQIICSVCAERNGFWRQVAEPAPGAIEEAKEMHKRRKRNENES
jgi:hypothetical protein